MPLPVSSVTTPPLCLYISAPLSSMSAQVIPPSAGECVDHSPFLLAWHGLRTSFSCSRGRSCVYCPGCIVAVGKRLRVQLSLFEEAWGGSIIPDIARFNPLARVGIMSSLAMATLEVQEDPVTTASKDLLVIGPGVLGKLVAALWMKQFPGCCVLGQTATTNHHQELQALGIKPLLKGSQSGRSFPYVVFCAPPSGSLDYAAELRLSAEQWDRTGVFLFTSSSAVYDCADNGECDEDTPIVPLGRSPRTDVLLRAEQEVLQVGGTVLRLAGLYTKERGPHAYWAKKGIVDARPDHILNLIHYEDAASLCVTILKRGYQKEVFMGCDNHPLSRQEVMNIVNESGKLEDKFEAFTGIDGPLGKKMNCNRSRSKTGWQPKYTSFAEFIQNVA